MEIFWLEWWRGQRGRELSLSGTRLWEECSEDSAVTKSPAVATREPNKSHLSTKTAVRINSRQGRKLFRVEKKQALNDTGAQNCPRHAPNYHLVVNTYSRATASASVSVASISQRAATFCFGFNRTFAPGQAIGWWLRGRELRNILHSHWLFWTHRPRFTQAQFREGVANLGEFGCW